MVRLDQCRERNFPVQETEQVVDVLGQNTSRWDLYATESVLFHDEACP